MTRTLHEIELGRRITFAEPFVSIAIVSPRAKCPLCDGLSQWRRGVGFDHERRCDGCNVSWEPDRAYLILERITPTPKEGAE